MSMVIMFRKCEHCGHKYPYNPSVGQFGVFCPKCKKAQKNILQIGGILGKIFRKKGK